MSKSTKKKSVTQSKRAVKLTCTFSWTFTQKEWEEMKSHIEDIEKNPRIVTGYDPFYTLDLLNQLVPPDFEDARIVNVNPGAVAENR